MHLRQCGIVCWLVLLANWVAWVDPSCLKAGEPLHQRIDAIIDTARIGPAVKLCSDADFVRRIHLDLVGVAPTAAEAKRFIDDPSPDKRRRLVEQLLADERFAHHMRMVFDAMLMERRPAKHVKQVAWRAFLTESFRDGKPLNELAREILWAGPEVKSPAAARFYLDREVQPHLVTRDIGRLMLGRDLHCAQCRDHPVIGDYQQSEYYGLFAFVNRSYLFADKKKKRTLLAEKAEGDVSFESVFDKGAKYPARPRLPGRPEVKEPKLAKDQLYKVKPPKGGYGVPAYSRRRELAKRLTAGDNEQFNRNMANRLWAIMFGRGIVHPLDLNHRGNPPAHPELLTLLAEKLVQSNFDVRVLLKQIALSRAYQRSCRLPDRLGVSKADVERVIARSSKQREETLAEARAAKQQSREISGRIAAAEALLDKARTMCKEAQASLTAAEKKIGRHEQELAKAVRGVAAELAAFTVVIARQAPGQDRNANSPKPGKGAASVSPDLAKAAQLVEQNLAALNRARQEVAAAKASLAKAERDCTVIEKMTNADIGVLRATLRKTRQRGQAASAKVNKAKAAIKDAQALLAVLTAKGEAERGEARQKLQDRWGERFFVRDLRPLSPEQMALSLYQAVGDLEARFRAAVESETAKAKKKKPDESKAEAQGEAISRRAHQSVYDQLQGVIDELAGVFAQSDGQPTLEFEGRAMEALYLTNSSRIGALVRGRLAQRLAAMKGHNSLAEELYLAVLSRRPTAGEAAAVAGYLAGREKDRQTAIEEMIWGLVSSTEFRFNH